MLVETTASALTTPSAGAGGACQVAVWRGTGNLATELHLVRNSLHAVDFAAVEDVRSGQQVVEFSAGGRRYTVQPSTPIVVKTTTTTTAAA